MPYLYCIVEALKLTPFCPVLVYLVAVDNKLRDSITVSTLENNSSHLEYFFLDNN